MPQELIPIVSSLTPGKLSDAIGNSLADGWQALVGDKISAYRIKNAAALSDRLTRDLAESGQAPDWGRLPDRFAVSWFEHATNEDEPRLHELFTTLLKRAAEGCNEALERRNIELLSRFTVADAILVKAVYEEYFSFKTADAQGLGYMDEWAEFQRHTKRDQGGFDSVAYENLRNFGVIEVQRVVSLDPRKLERWYRGKAGLDGGSTFTDYPVEDAVVGHDEVYLTQTGRSLMIALFVN